jgi:hypothetical protein
MQLVGYVKPSLNASKNIPLKYSIIEVKLSFIRKNNKNIHLLVYINHCLCLASPSLKEVPWYCLTTEKSPGALPFFDYSPVWQHKM